MGDGAATHSLHLGAEQANFGVAALVAAAIPWLLTQKRLRSVKELSARDAASLMARGDALLVDCRSQPGMGGPDVPSLVRSPFFLADGSRSVSFADDVAYAAGAHPVVLLSADGSVASAAARELARTTRSDVFVLTGGLAAWVAEGLPVNGDAPAALSPTVLASEREAAERAGSHRLLAPFRPKLLTVLAEGYSAADLRADVLAGLSVGVIALSLSMALGIASESTPAAGLYTAVAAGFVVSALGGSRVAIGGPTAAFIPLVVSVAHAYGVAGLTTCTLMAGGMLVALGFSGAGSYIARIPKPVVTGFTAGIAVFIFSTQLRDFAGIHDVGPVPSQFVDKLQFLGHHLDAANLPSLALATASVLLLRAYPASWARVVPPQIVVVAASMATLAALNTAGIETGIETIGSRFGADAIPSSLPVPHLALPSMELVVELLPPAFTIAVLAAIESLLCAVVSDGMIDDKHDPNTELVAQGLANILSASVGGLPATGALARTAANVRCGGRSPVSGMVHAATVLFILVAAAPLAAYVPLPALSGVLVVVALNMGEWKNARELPNWLPGDAAVYLTSCILTVLTDVTIAVEAGLFLSLLIYVARVTEAADVQPMPSPPRDRGNKVGELPLPSAPGIATLRLSGPLLFGASDKLEHAAALVGRQADTRVLVLDCSQLSSLDSTTLEALHLVEKTLLRDGKTLILSGLRSQPHAAVITTGLAAQLGHANVVRDAAEAVRRAHQLE